MRNQEAAFSPSITSPEGEKKKASEGNDVCPVVLVAVDMKPTVLTRSGQPSRCISCNREVSKQLGPEKEGGAENSASGDNNLGETMRSGPGLPKKGRRSKGLGWLWVIY